MEFLSGFGVAPEQFLYLVALLLVVVVLALPLRSIGFARLAGYAAAWTLIFGGLWWVFDHNPAAQRFMADAARPEQQVEVLSGEPGAEVRVRAALDGHFWVRAQVNGQPVRFLVDTGASDVVLSARTAERVGIAVNRLSFDRPGYSASGYVRAASARVDRLTIGPIVRQEMPVSVLAGEVDVNLLGMRFLRSLSGWRVEKDTLILQS